MAESIDAPFLQTALEVVSRASSSSEVLSLNLTNLIILLALKVAIVAFGLFSGMCFLLYTGGDAERLSCVARAACESPASADNYLAAAKMWYKMHKLIKAVPFTEKYQTVMQTVYQASEFAKE